MNDNSAVSILQDVARCAIRDLDSANTDTRRQHALSFISPPPLYESVSKHVLEHQTDPKLVTSKTEFQSNFVELKCHQDTPKARAAEDAFNTRSAEAPVSGTEAPLAQPAGGSRCNHYVPSMSDANRVRDVQHTSHVPSRGSVQSRPVSELRVQKGSQARSLRSSMSEQILSMHTAFASIVPRGGSSRRGSELETRI